jgi:CheY-like chemotaxis protein
MNSSKKILIVDDTPENLLLLKEILINDDVEIFTANGGSAAINMLSVNEFDLVLLDLFMPGINGFDVLKKMNEAEGEKPPVIMISSEDNFHIIEKAYALGIKKYLVYPVIINKLREEVASVLFSNCN